MPSKTFLCVRVHSLLVNRLSRNCYPPGAYRTFSVTVSMYRFPGTVPRCHGSRSQGNRCGRPVPSIFRSAYTSRLPSDIVSLDPGNSDRPVTILILSSVSLRCGSEARHPYNPVSRRIALPSALVFPHDVWSFMLSFFDRTFGALLLGTFVSLPCVSLFSLV